MTRSVTKIVALSLTLVCFSIGAQAQPAKPPKIAGFSPDSGPPGQEIKIKGSGFGNNSGVVEVRLGGVPVEVVSVKNNEIRVKVSPQSRTGVLQLAVAGIRSNPTSTLFEVFPALKATKMDPMTVNPGGEVRIFGSGFTPNPADHILFIGKLKVVASRIEGTAAVFTVPSKAVPGPNVVRFEVKKRGVINIPVALTIMDGAAVTDFAPTQGAPGTVITISGKGFGSSPAEVRVMMGGQFAQVSSAMPNTIVATVPAISAPSPITVQTRSNGTAVSAKSFTVSVPIVITSFAPTAGQPNQQVRLYGQGFDSSSKRNHVTINGKNAQILEAAPNTLVVKIPPGISSDVFQVTVDGRGTGVSQGLFQIAEPLFITSFTPESGSVGAYVRITGKGFTTSGMRAFIGQKPVGLRVYSATQALIGVPAGAVDSPIVMVSPTGVRATSKTAFKIVADVSVNKFYPISGRPGTKVTLYGDQFDIGKTKIFLGKAELKPDTGMSNTMMVVTIPDAAESGPFRVAVAGRREIRSVGAFKVLPPAETFVPKQETKQASSLEIKPDDKPVIEKLMAETPTQAVPSKKDGGKAPTIDELLGFESDGQTVQISGIDPTEGPVGETITINGSGFGDDPKKVSAWVGETKADVVGCVPDMIMIEVPAGATTAKVKIKVGGKAPLTSKVDFVVK
jgi:hypothetical protein